MFKLKKTGIFLQVRLNSNRMPGKALLDINGKPLICHVMERLKVVPADIRVLLTTAYSEPYIRSIAEKSGWDVYIGDTQNVLKRFVDAALNYQVDIVIRATGDNPLLSSEIALETIALFNNKGCDLAYLAPIPYGSGVEVVKRKVLEEALQKSQIPYHLEHVTPYIYANNEKFKILENKYHDEEVSRPDIRITVDTREDYEKANYLFRRLNEKKMNLTINSIVRLWDQLCFDKYKRMLFIVVCDQKNGLGHLKRCLLLASKLNDTFYCYFSAVSDQDNAIRMIKQAEYEYLFFDSLSDFVSQQGVFDRVVLDVRDTGPEEILSYQKLGPLFSIDDLGEGGQSAYVNIKTLPSPRYSENKLLQFNFNGIEYLFFDQKTAIPAQPGERPLLKNILITFGGSDPGGLTSITYEALKELPYQITLVLGPLYQGELVKAENETENCRIIKAPYSLAPYIEEADLIVTSFGMTFFESLSFQKPVFLLNPTDYHEELTLELNYRYFIQRFTLENSPDIDGEVRQMVKKMEKELFLEAEPEKSFINDYYQLPIAQKFHQIVDFIKECSPTAMLCPYCCHEKPFILHRNQKWNMYQCRKCSLIFINHLIIRPFEYNDRYFLEEYKNQYGKTYAEDRENIRKLAAVRLKLIREYITSGDILDIGSGLGFFAEYCREHGFNALSIDHSQYAVTYMQEQLNLEAICADYTYLEKSDRLFDGITAFYFIEHIHDFEKFIFLVYQHLKKKGVIALSTPNAAGYSVKMNFSHYITQHPDDHYRIFSPRFLKKILKKAGFTQIKINITGIHPERIFPASQLLKNRFIHKIVVFMMKLYRLGDTFEIYAQKK